MRKNKTPLPDTSINKLGFPKRAITAFQSEKINTLNELLAFNEDDLFSLPNVGKTALAKVLLILEEFGLELGRPLDDKADFKSLPKEKPNSEEKLNPHDPVSKLKLSVRAFNSLQSVNIKTIGQLARLNTDELLKIPNLGTVEGAKKIKVGSTSATRITFNQKPNVAVKSNVWIDKYAPARNFFAASHESNLEKVKKVIPGDYMIDFIYSENPLQDPTNVNIIRNTLTSRQRAEYIAYQFFLKGGANGYIAEQNKFRKSTYHNLERYPNDNKKLSKVTINGGLLLRACGWLPNGKPSTTKVEDGHGVIAVLNNQGGLIMEEKYLDGIPMK
jgi:hypothetical protein